MENLYFEEEILNFGEHSSDSSILSSATKNNLIEGKVLPSTSSTTNRGKENILGKNRKGKLQIQNKKYLEYNEHVSDSNDNTKEDIRRNTNINNRSSHSNYDQVRKNSNGGERYHTPRMKKMETLVVVVVKHH